MYYNIESKDNTRQKYHDDDNIMQLIYTQTATDNPKHTTSTMHRQG